MVNFGIHRPNDFPKKAYERLSFHFPDLTLNEVRNAAKLAYQEQENRSGGEYRNIPL